MMLYSNSEGRRKNSSVSLIDEISFTIAVYLYLFSTRHRSLLFVLGLLHKKSRN